mgnify:CR=1 FL=1
MNNQLTKLDFLDKQATIFKNSKQIIERNDKEIQEIVTNNTKQEVIDVQDAINTLNKKLDQIMKSELIKEKSNIITNESKKMKLSIEVATNTFLKIRKMLYEKNLSRQQRVEYEKKVYDKIVSKFLNAEEVKQFEQLIKIAPIMMFSQKNNFIC